MERGSDKHGRLTDEELKEEVGSLERGAPPDSRAREERQQEAPADDEPVPDARTGRAGASGALGADPEEAKREIARAVEPSVFPADRDELLQSAEEAHARQPVLDALRSLPEGRTFATVKEVWAALSSSSAR